MKNKEESEELRDRRIERAEEKHVRRLSKVDESTRKVIVEHIVGESYVIRWKVECRMSSRSRREGCEGGRVSVG